jgi:uncharacterized membrane protein
MTLTDPITHTANLTGIRWLSLATAFGSVVTGGTLFGFSAFVLPALRRLPTAEAVSAMQAINVQAPRSVLMLPLVGSALGSAAIVVLALVRSDTPNRGWLLAGAAAGLLTFVITAVYHVPHNDAFARLDPAASAAATAWRHYIGGWAWWNHARTATALMSGVVLVAGAWPRSR